MADPLFTPHAAPPASPSNAVRFMTDDRDLSFLVPAGWVGEGRIQTEPPDHRFVVFDVTGPDDALIYCGHPDLPQYYVVPAPWHGAPAPGRRSQFGDGAAARWLFPAPLATAPQMARHLATRRFGDVVVTRTEPLARIVEEARDGMRATEIEAPFVDACRASFTSMDGQHAGMIQLVVFGGDQPGDRWQIDHISGYQCAPDAIDVIAPLYDAVMASVVIGAGLAEP